ncbi:hypothetical protein TW81_02270 [Vibrio galatheae]|uniref:Uncharacterized protein n=1 Tax=Vibrio galatheae TaxID=579748 RepID=A0A0F4NNU7_9VIBR|nr:hypothetical protein [Vibrio galatheae]KJY84840.1 hypothetical protein TW81_02270 [Vibrio galatheae]
MSKYQEALQALVNAEKAGAPEEQLRALAQYAHHLKSTQADRPPEFEATPYDYADAALQGLTFGFNDEIQSGIGAGINVLTGGDWDYEERQQAKTARRKQFQENAPISAVATEGAGGMVTGAAGAAKALATQVAKKAPKLATSVIGALEGAVYGAGQADTLEEVPQDAAVGAGVGAVAAPLLGGLINKGGELTKKGTGWIWNRLNDNPEKQAKRFAQELAGYTGKSIDEIAESYRKAGSEAVLADLDPNLQAGASLTTRGMSNARTKATNFLNDRQSNQQDRITKAANDLFGNQGDELEAIVSDIAQQRSRQADELYGVAYGKELQPSESLESLVGRLDEIGAFDKASKLANIEGRDPSSIGDVEMLDYAKRHLDDLITSAKRQGNNNEARVYTKLKEDLIETVDQQVPEYRAARDAFAGESALIEAAEAGVNFDKMSVKEIESLMETASASEAELFRTGVGRAIKDKMDKVADTHNAGQRLFGKPEQRKKLIAVTGSEESADMLLDQIEREAMYTQTRQRLTGNSMTADNQTIQQEANASVTGQRLSEVASGNWLGTAMDTVNALLKGKDTTPEFKDELAKILLNPNLSESELRRILTHRGIPPERLNQVLTTSGNSVRGAIVPGLLAPSAGMMDQ